MIVSEAQGPQEAMALPGQPLNTPQALALRSEALPALTPHGPTAWPADLMCVAHFVHQDPGGSSRLEALLAPTKVTCWDQSRCSNTGLRVQGWGWGAGTAESFREHSLGGFQEDPVGGLRTASPNSDKDLGFAWD